MTPQNGRCALLLRAVNVSGRNRVPMAELRSLLSERGVLTGVSTYIASGNVIAETPADPGRACIEVRALIEEAFGVDTPVVLRTHDQLVAALEANPFSDALVDKLLHLMFLAGPSQEGAIDSLTPRLVPGERIALRGQDLWIDYSEGGVHSTKLTTAVFDRALGVAGTARNLRTVRKLVELTA
ncbi:uncharacterized protein (DUF1697 family) [Microbacterium resistens]|uniref:Uncharacterized protein (DUF1697 family) n=1 Tax=Microbacterium resistens TaxID=156977 RepID=A0ABU1SDE4_9MICO|nr:DUF1697 domain-containing protein [Microbacterium resistens]MDR6867628.1 uncharacterized protein (DUF1697 family) [Microbacterium resistens]